MNIVIAGTVEFNPQIGGTERVSVTLANQFKKLGYGVYFVALTKCPYSKPYIPVAEQIILPNESDACCEDNIRCFTNIITEKKIDIILNQFGNMDDFSELCMIVREKTGIKLLSELHIDPAYEIKLYKAETSLLYTKCIILRQLKNYSKKLFAFKKLHSIKKFWHSHYNRLYQKCDAVILLSEYYKPIYKKMAGLADISKLEAINNPLSFQEVKEEIYQKENQILWIGRFDSMHKRPERMVQIWSLLEDKHPDWSLLFLGDGPCKDAVESLVKHLNLKNVKFAGFTDPINEYKKSSILCSTSTMEGLPMILLEAMQFGAIPMSFSSFESIYDVVDDEINGYIIPPYDLKLYANRLESLMTDKNRRKLMSQNAKEYVSGRFNVEKITKIWLGLFDKINQ